MLHSSREEVDTTNIEKDLYVQCVAARGSSIADFGRGMGFLLTGHGSLKDFFLSRILAFSQTGVFMQ